MRLILPPQMSLLCPSPSFGFPDSQSRALLESGQAS